MLNLNQMCVQSRWWHGSIDKFVGALHKLMTQNKESWQCIHPSSIMGFAIPVKTIARHQCIWMGAHPYSNVPSTSRSCYLWLATYNLWCLGLYMLHLWIAILLWTAWNIHCSQRCHYKAQIVSHWSIHKVWRYKEGPDLILSLWNDVIWNNSFHKE